MLLWSGAVSFVEPRPVFTSSRSYNLYPDPLPPDRSTAIRAGSAAFPRVIFGTPSLHDSTRSLPASLACLYGRSSRRCPFPPRFGVCKLHHFRSAPSTSYRMQLPIQAARNQGVVSMRRPTPRGRPPEPYSPSSTTSHDGHITASPALDVDGLVNGPRGPEHLARGRVTSRSTLSMIMPSVGVHQGRRCMQWR